MQECRTSVYMNICITDQHGSPIVCYLCCSSGVHFYVYSNIHQNFQWIYLSNTIIKWYACESETTSVDCLGGPTTVNRHSLVLLLHLSKQPHNFTFVSTGNHYQVIPLLIWTNIIIWCANLIEVHRFNTIHLTAIVWTTKCFI